MSSEPPHNGDHVAIYWIREEQNNPSLSAELMIYGPIGAIFTAVFPGFLFGLFAFVLIILPKHIIVCLYRKPLYFRSQINDTVFERASFGPIDLLGDVVQLD